MPADRQRPSDPPLRGISVLITRPAYAAGELAREITAFGGTPLRQPGLTIKAVDDDEPSLSSLAQLHQTDWLIFTSRPAVKYGLARIDRHALSGQCQVMAIGSGTAGELLQAGLTDIATSPQASSEAMLAWLTPQDIRDRRVIIVCAHGGRIVLEQGLTAHGARVQSIYVYQRSQPTLDEAVLGAVINDFSRLVVTASSVTMLENLMDLYRGQTPQPLQTRPLAVYSQRIADGARDLGFEQVAVADRADDEALLQTVNLLARKMKGRNE